MPVFRVGDRVRVNMAFYVEESQYVGSEDWADNIRKIAKGRHATVVYVWPDGDPSDYVVAVVFDGDTESWEFVIAGLIPLFENTVNQVRQAMKEFGIGRVASNPDLRDTVQALTGIILPLSHVQRAREIIRQQEGWQEDRRMRDREKYGNKAISNEYVAVA